MILYDHSCGWAFFFRVIQRKGSVFPRAASIAIPCAIVSVALKWAGSSAWWPKEIPLDFLSGNSSLWLSFNTLLGFLLVFRTQQSYSRFWEGSTSIQAMQANWHSACSALCAFCVHSTADPKLISEFKHVLMRLVSLLHACALGELGNTHERATEDTRIFELNLLDIEGLDEKTLEKLQRSDTRVELVYQWIQLLIVNNVGSVLSVPPPILSRSFQEMSNGMLGFNKAMNLSNVPFPFPYAQTCDMLLLTHWLLVPFQVNNSTSTISWAACFSFVQIMIAWTMNLVALELENPFGTDDNDLDSQQMQTSMNKKLAMLLEHDADHVPCVRPTVFLAAAQAEDATPPTILRHGSTLSSAWEHLECETSHEVGAAHDRVPAARVGTGRRRRRCVSQVAASKQPQEDAPGGGSDSCNERLAESRAEREQPRSSPALPSSEDPPAVLIGGESRPRRMDIPIEPTLAHSGSLPYLCVGHGLHRTAELFNIMSSEVAPVPPTGNDLELSPDDWQGAIRSV